MAKFGIIRNTTLWQPYYRKDVKAKESSEASDGMRDVKDILRPIKIIIYLQRELLNLSADANDEGANVLMSGYIREQEEIGRLNFLNKKMMLKPAVN